MVHCWKCTFHIRLSYMDHPVFISVFVYALSVCLFGSVLDHISLCLCFVFWYLCMYITCMSFCVSMHIVQDCFFIIIYLNFFWPHHTVTVVHDMLLSTCVVVSLAWYLKNACSEHKFSLWSRSYTPSIAIVHTNISIASLVDHWWSKER